MNANPSPDQIHPRILAHLGDSVYELHIREMAVQQAIATASNHVESVHRYTTDRANAAFQVHLLHALDPLLTETEREIVRRGRNVSVSVARRSNQATHRQATSFETLIGYLYLSDRERLAALFQELTPLLLEPPQ